MISPYALLSASRPKSNASIVTAYDLYSAVQSHADAPLPPPAPASKPEPSPPAALPRLQGRRTHYIREIGLRHNSAANRTIFTAPPSD